MTNPSVLITGSSSGIGLATALEMRDRGWTVFATARKAEDLESLASHQITPIELDVSNSDSIRQAAETVRTKTEGKLSALVNNAGYGQPGALEDLTRDQMRQQFEVNIFGLLELTNLLLPDMIQQGHGRIVHVSSVVGRIALPFMGIYSASKFAVEALADVQRVELDGTGIKVSLVEPGPIRTKFSKNAVAASNRHLERGSSRFQGLYAHELTLREESEAPKPFSLPPEAVARKIAHALTAKHPRTRYHVTLPAHLGAFLSRFAPDRFIDYVLTKELRQRKSKAETANR
jgi:short-subunit dehydrogenase